MAYTPSRDDGEKNKFRKTDDNNTVVATIPTSIEGNSVSINGDGQLSTETTLLDENGYDISVQHPLPTDGDSIYFKDIDTNVSDNGDFSGNVTDYFDNLTSVNNNTTANSPKTIKLWFKRTAYSSAIGLGCNDLTGNFSNIKIELLGSGETVRETIDLSTDNTKFTSKLIQFSPSAFNGMNIHFYTTDEVCLSNITVRKEVKVVAQLEAIKTDGTTVEIGATNSGNLKVTDAENGLAISKGLVTGSSFVHKFGYAPDFDTSDGVITIWDGANDAGINQMRYVYSTTAAINSISSSSASDTVIIQLQGLDANYNLVTQEVTLNGQTRVALTTPLLRVFRMKNNNGTDLVGNVYVYENTALSGGVPTDSTKVRAVIQNGFNQTLMAVYTIPAGKTGYLRDWYVSAAGASKDSSYIFQVRAREAGKVFQLKHISSVSDSGTSYVQHQYTEPEVFGEKVDIEMRVSITAVGATGAAFSAGFDIVLVDNE